MNMPLPDAIKNAPSLEFGLGLYQGAFWDLDTCRQRGNGVGPIPWTAVFTYCEQYEIVGEQRDDMFHHITQMDNVYIAHHVSKSEIKK